MKNLDPKNLSKFITYVDMNNLYDWGLSGYFPNGGFEWLKNIYGFDVNSISRYFFEVDLKYPDKLHELHNDYPLAPEKLAVSSKKL